MKREQHPEHIQSLCDRETAARCRKAVEEWKAGGLPLEVPEYGISWTPAAALDLVRALQAMFQAYNRVLWEQFPYCRACGGQCCVNEASHVGLLDGVALALLGCPLPDLPPDLPAGDRACVYLNGLECALPVEWRTIKCWSFFCLGGLWDPAVPLGERYHDLTAALKGVLRVHLPEALRRYEQVGGDPLADHLHDPADLAAALDDALWETLVGPLHARYPLFDGDSPAVAGGESGADRFEGELLAFVAEAIEQVLVDPPPVPEGLPLTVEQLLEDLEALEWIVVGQPTHRGRLLQEMGVRYVGAPAPVDGERPSVWYRMRVRLEALLP